MSEAASGAVEKLRGSTVINEIKKAGVRHILSVPDLHTSKGLLHPIAVDPEFKLIRVCKEDEILGIAAGLTYGNLRSLMLVQYTGFLYAMNAIRGVAIAMNEPRGVIAALCPDEAPLLGLISIMAPAIAMGNSCVLIPSDTAPLSATDLYQVLETSDLPAGVVNIVTGSHMDLAKPLSGHMDVDAVWSCSAHPLSALIETESAGNLKRTWVNQGRARDWYGSEAEGRAFLRQATDVKTVWVPYGE